MRVVYAAPGKPAEIRDVQKGMESMQALVHGTFDCLPMHGGFDLWINDEGRLRFFDESEPELFKDGSRVFAPNRLIRGKRATEYWDVIGPLFVAASTDEGETIGLTEKQAEQVRAWLDGGNDICRPLEAEEIDEPMMVVSSFTA